MTPEQLRIIKCLYLDLQGAVYAHVTKDRSSFDIKSALETLDELELMDIPELAQLKNNNLMEVLACE